MRLPALDYNIRSVRVAKIAIMRSHRGRPTWLSRPCLSATSSCCRRCAQSFGGRVEARYRVPVATWAITPCAAVQTQNFNTPTYSETDVNQFPRGADQPRN